jgi:lipoate-protein ligase A
MQEAARETASYNRFVTDFRLIRSAPAMGSENMALDEAILEAVESGRSPPTLRLYAWDPPCLSIGYAQSSAVVDSDRMAAAGWDLVRRPTGGKAILHTDELTYSIIGRARDPLFAGGVVPSYERLSAGLVAALAEFGAQPQVHSGNSENGDNPICFEVPGVHELTVNGMKLIGSAQLRHARGVLQHGSLPLAGDIGRICQILKYDRDSNRGLAAESVRRKATTLEQAIGHAVDWRAAADAMATGFRSALGLELQLAEPSSEERERAAELRQSRYGNAAWNERL